MNYDKETINGPVESQEEKKPTKLEPNVPYVKQYDSHGNLVNPIPLEGYLNTGPNRRQRRANRKIINKFIKKLKRKKK